MTRLAVASLAGIAAVALCVAAVHVMPIEKLSLAHGRKLLGDRDGSIRKCYIDKGVVPYPNGPRFNGQDGVKLMYEGKQTDMGYYGGGKMPGPKPGGIMGMLVPYTDALTRFMCRTKPE